eukprot:CAMPEP_0117480962 /NCGR_PEP_ID=MMETSP0784-20121206/12659_1 /TAXON_ID=39447 /ORGANISM="" /LENGTH=642 /DNA_ID=CAMNT_0005275413 /DNA_START=32 /DNA_END=1960 /DNA_ORIENTATION=+
MPWFTHAFAALIALAVPVVAIQYSTPKGPLPEADVAKVERAIKDYQTLNATEKEELASLTLDKSKVDERTWYLYKEAVKETRRDDVKKKMRERGDTMGDDEPQTTKCADVTSHHKEKYEACYQKMQWIRLVGFDKPYAREYMDLGLSRNSPLSAFQKYLHMMGQMDCPEPCGTVKLGLDVNDPAATHEAYKALQAAREDAEKGWSIFNRAEEDANTAFGEMLETLSATSAEANAEVPDVFLEAADGDHAFGFHAVETPSADCANVVDGSMSEYEKCFDAMEWIRINGFVAPYFKYYSEFGLSEESPWRDFQMYLHSLGKNKCPMPCPVETPAPTPQPTPEPTFAPTARTSLLTSSLVSVLSAVGNVDRREAIRKSFEQADLGDELILRFILCENVPWESDEDSSDVVVVSCEDGDHSSFLTKKTKEVLNVFNTRYAKRSLLIITEDDTFVAWRRLQLFLQALSPNSNPVRYYNGYMGVMVGAGHPVNRIPTSDFYQPASAFADNTYPMHMEGSFTVLGKELVRQILEFGIANRYPLNNREAAVGVWVDKLKQEGTEVKYIGIPGTHSVGEEQYLGCNKTWGEYPYFVQHSMEPKELECLSEADHKNDRSRPIEPCFPGCKDVIPFVADKMATDEKSLGPADR